MNLFYAILILGTCFATTHSENKYSAQANAKHESKYDGIKEPTNFRTLEKPFRMAKMNVLWTKAQLRLTETKLKSLFTDLKIHDKELLAHKKLKSDSGDKDGLKEAEIRQKLATIMINYGLLEHFEDVSGNLPKNEKYNDMAYINKSLFKDKRLSMLWDKAEKAGFTAEELKALKEEFGHHQEKIDQYYSLMKDVEGKDDAEDENSIDEKLDRFNSIDKMEQQEVLDKKFQNKANSLRDLHHDVKEGFDRLHRIAAQGPQSREFIEPKVQGLWRLANSANFSSDELESLKTELLHYENRLLKLRHLHAEAEINHERTVKKKAAVKPSDGLLLMEETIKKQERKVEKLRLELETKIMQKHIEL